jgi:chromosome segregation ATPase
VIAKIALINTNVRMPLFPELCASSLFAGRHWSNCRNVMMGAGICLAAVGAGVGFAMQATITAVTFIVLGIILLLSALSVNNSDKEMRNSIQLLKMDNEQLKLDAEDTDRNTEELIFESEVLNRNTEELILESEALKQISHAMALQMAQMHREKEALRQKNDAIQRVIPLLQAQVDRYNDENQAIGKEVGLLRQDIERLADDREHFDLALNEAQENLRDIGALSQSIARAQAISQEIIHSWRREREELTAQLMEMQNMAGGTRAFTADLAKRAKEIEEAG